MFFNDTTSNYLQQIAIFVEVTGFIFVIIEVYFPDTGRKIENTIDNLSTTRLTSLGDMNPWHWLAQKRGKKQRDYSLLIIDIFISLILMVIFLEWMKISRKIYILILISPFFLAMVTLICIIISMYIQSEINNKFILLVNERCLGCWLHPLVMFLGITILIFSAVPTLLIYYPMSKIFSLFNLIGRGKAIGALGLLLSLIGLTFEVYQVITLCFSNGCYGIKI